MDKDLLQSASDELTAFSRSFAVRAVHAEVAKRFEVLGAKLAHCKPEEVDALRIESARLKGMVDMLDFAKDCLHSIAGSEIELKPTPQKRRGETI